MKQQLFELGKVISLFAVIMMLVAGGFYIVSLPTETDVEAMFLDEKIEHTTIAHARPTPPVKPESMRFSPCKNIGSAGPLDELARSIQSKVVRVAIMRGDDAIGSSGFIVDVDDGLVRILTSYHAVEGTNIRVVCFHDNQSYGASLESHNKSEDWAVLTVCCLDEYYPATVGSVGSLWYGDEVLVVGYPAVVGHKLSAEYGSIVKEPDCRIGQFTIAGTAVSGKGTSGGPVFSENREVVGMIASGGTISGDRYVCASPLPDWEG